jgi:hypothetical protein
MLQFLSKFIKEERKTYVKIMGDIPSANISQNIHYYKQHKLRRTVEPHAEVEQCGF